MTEGGMADKAMCAADDRDFEAVYARYRPEIVRYLSRLAGQNDAEDLAQEVFLKVGRGIADFRGDSGIRTWIYRIARNAAIDRLRSRSAGEDRLGAYPEAGDSAGEGDILDRLESPLPSAERTLAEKETRGCLRGHVGLLPGPYREILDLSEWSELTNAEIAEKLGVSLDTVKIRLHRARKRLRETCETNCTTYRDEQDELVCVPAKESPKSGKGVSRFTGRTSAVVNPGGSLT
jgi:RNA polymerase sigma-70 factor (ECF subfamily)